MITKSDKFKLPLNHFLHSAVAILPTNDIVSPSSFCNDSGLPFQSSRNASSAMSRDAGGRGFFRKLGKLKANGLIHRIYKWMEHEQKACVLLDSSRIQFDCVFLTQILVLPKIYVKKMQSVRLLSLLPSSWHNSQASDSRKKRCLTGSAVNLYGCMRQVSYQLHYKLPCLCMSRVPSLKLTACPENGNQPQRKVVFQPSIFSGYVSLREGGYRKIEEVELIIHFPAKCIESIDRSCFHHSGKNE